MGDDAGKVEKSLEGIAADPVKALASLNQQYNFLSVSQLRHIDELERTKGKQAAVTEAMSLFADVMNARLEQLDKRPRRWKKSGTMLKPGLLTHGHG